MGKALRVGALALVAVGALAGAAPAANAATFYVSNAGSDTSNDCTNAAAPCNTIAHAVASSEATPGTATIELAPGTYAPPAALTNLSDFGLTIAGTGAGPTTTVIQGAPGASGATVRYGPGGGLGQLTLSNVTVANPAGNNQSGVSGSGALTLSSTLVEVSSGDSSPAVSNSVGPTTIAGTTLTTAGTGRSLQISSGSLAMSSSSVSQTDTSSGSAAVFVQNGAATISGSTITSAGSGGDAYQGQNSSLSMSSSTVSGTGHAGAIVNVIGGVALTADQVSMPDPGDSAPAVSIQEGTLSMGATTVSGAWTGAGVQTTAVGGSIVGSTITTADGGNSSIALAVQNGPPGTALLVQRSVIEASPGASPGAADVLNEDAVFDSSLILGGGSGIYAQEQGGKSNTTTVVSSTVDGGVIGSGQQTGFSSVQAAGSGAGDQVTINVAGSILLQQPAATETSGGTSSVACAYTDVPATVQAGSPTLGTIACPSGSAGNVTTSPSALFVGFGSDYQLAAGSTAVDQVPESAVTPLPDGFAASTTDLAGNPRVVDGSGGCTPVRDRGAYELQGHSGAVPAVAISAPATAGAGVIATYTASAPNAPSASFAWTFSDGTTATGSAVKHAFAAAGSASVTVTATGTPAACVASASASVAVVSAPRLSPLKLAKASFRAGRRGGTAITYSDSQASTTTFTILAHRTGRRQGKTCRAASRANASHPTCRLEVAIGHFAHHDVAGANHLTFHALLGGHALAPGTYVLRAVPSGPGGKGRAVERTFTIR